MGIIDVDARTLLQPSFYVRRDTDEDLIRRYSEALEAGAVFPPVTVARLGDDLILLDGAHRRKAYLRRGLTVIRAEVVDVGPADFVLEALARNARHGSPLSEADQRRTLHELRRARVPFARIVEATAIPLHRLERMLVERSTRPAVRSAASPVSSPMAARDAGCELAASGVGRRAAEGSGGDAIERALVELTTGLERRDLGAVPPDILIAWYRRAAMAVETLEKAIRRRGVSAVAR